MSFNSNDYKGFTFRSGAVKKTTEQNSTFWDTNSNDVDVDEFLGLDTNVKKGKDLVALAGYKRAISNFVNIVTEQSIPVVFNSNDQSYTDGKKVVIGSNIDDKKFMFLLRVLVLKDMMLFQLLSLFLTMLKIEELTLSFSKLHLVINLIITQCMKSIFIQLQLIKVYYLLSLELKLLILICLELLTYIIRIGS